MTQAHLHSKHDSTGAATNSERTSKAAPNGLEEPHLATADFGGCGCAGDANNGHATAPAWPRLLCALALALLAECAHLLGAGPAWSYAGMALAVAAVALSGVGVYQSGIRSLLRGRLGIDTLMAVAVTGAFLIGQWPEAAMVMALYAIAERLEHAAAERARNAIGALMKLVPDEAERLDENGNWQRVPVNTVSVGDSLRLRPGGHIPLDGIVLEGEGAVDQSSVTGESIPIDKSPGDALYAGTLNTASELVMQVRATTGTTTLDRIIEAVENAQASRAPTERFIARFANIYTPMVFALALALALLAPVLMAWPWKQSIYQALVLLVIACPCALLISVPVTIVSGLTAAARRNIVIKGGGFLENARRLRVVAFDKTGTITAGQPELVSCALWPLENAENQAERRASTMAAPSVHQLSAALAERSDHPVANAIARGLATPATQAEDRTANFHAAAPDTPCQITAFKAVPGRGVEGTANGRRLVLGNYRWMQERGLGSAALEAALQNHQQQGYSVSLLADDARVLAIYAIADTIKPHTREAMLALQTLGVRTVMLSGDNVAAATAIAQQAGIGAVRADLMPQDKQAAIAALQEELGAAVAMVGDGINDAPALAQADAGFAMGAAGTDVALEAADIVIMNDDPRRVAETIALSRRTRHLLWQNISFALGVKAVFFVLALRGNASMWMAVFADVGASLLVLANGMRLLRWKR